MLILIILGFIASQIFGGSVLDFRETYGELLGVFVSFLFFLHLFRFLYPKNLRRKKIRDSNFLVFFSLIKTLATLLIAALFFFIMNLKVVMVACLVLIAAKMYSILGFYKSRRIVTLIFSILCCLVVIASAYFLETIFPYVIIEICAALCVLVSFRLFMEGYFQFGIVLLSCFVLFCLAFFAGCGYYIISVSYLFLLAVIFFRVDSDVDFSGSMHTFLKSLPLVGRFFK